MILNHLLLKKRCKKISKLKYVARRLSNEDIISIIFYDPAEGFGSARDVLEKAEEKD